MGQGERIIGLDLGRLCGLASGRPGEPPQSRTVVLGGPRAGLAAHAAALLKLLDDEFRADRPRLVAKEAPFSLAAFRDHAVAESTVRSAYGLHCIAEAMCARWAIPCHDAHVSTVTKHLLGSARVGGRAARKRAIVARCIALGHLPRGCTDEDRADACAVFDWASATLARVPPREIRLFGEEA